MMPPDMPSVPSWYHVLESIRKLSTSLIWLLVLLIIAAILGRYFIFSTPLPPTSTIAPIVKPIVRPIVWQDIDKHLIEAVTRAGEETEKFANQRVEQWMAKLMQRVDSDFLEWYFSYWNQQVLGLNGLYHGIVHWLALSQQTAQERMTATVQQEFATRVLRPEIAQLEIGHLAEDTVKHYVDQLHTQLDAIPQQYHIPRDDWEKHLDTIAIMTMRVEGSREASLSLKALTGTTVASAAILTKSLAPLIKNIGGKLTAKLAGKAAASMAAKTGAKVMAKVGGELLGPVIAIGIIIWDVWDHAKTKETGMPLLRQNILDYFNELKISILSDSEYGILTIIHQLETQIVESANKNNNSP
jgi:hypothetical protein